MAVIDNRIVEIKFENHLFEEKVDKTISVIERLKRALNFKEEAESFDEVEKAANKMDFSALEKSINTLNDKFSAFGVAGMTVISDLTSSALDLAETLAKKIVSPIATGGWNRATNIDQAKFQLEGFGVAWDDIVDDINYGVKETAYGLDSAAKAASQLIASGVKFGETFGTTGNSPMAKALLGISGVAAITNSTYEDIASVYEAIAGRGKVSAMELNRLALRGMNAAQTLADSLHVTEEELREMVSDGEVSFEQFSEAMHTAFGKHAKDANKTFEGSLANMKAALSRIGAEFATPYRAGMIPIFNTLKEIINDIKTDKLKPLYADFASFADKASDFVVNVLDRVNFSWIGDVAQSLHIIYTEFDEFMSKVSPFWKSSKEDAEDAAKSVGLSAETVAEAVNKVIAGEYGNGDERKKALEEAFGIGAFEVIQNKVNELLGDLYRYDETISVIGGKIKKALSPFEELKSELDDIRKSSKGTSDSADDLREDIKSLRAIETQNAREAAAWQHVYDNIGDTFGGLGSLLSIFKKIVGAISKAMAGPMGNVALNLATAFTDITATIGRAITRLDEFLDKSGAYEKIGDIASKVGNTISNIFEQVSNFITSVINGESSLSKILPSFNDLLDSEGAVKFGNFFQKLLENLNKFAMGLSGNIIEDAFTIIGQILTGFAENLPKVTTALPAILTALRGLDLARRIGGLFTGSFNAITGVQRGLKAFILDINTDSLLKIAGAIAVFTAAITVLSLIPATNLVKAGLAILFIGTIIVQLFNALALINKSVTGNPLVDNITNFINALNAERNASSILKISFAFGVLAASMWALSHLSWEQLAIGALAIGAVTAALAGLIFVINKTSPALSRSPLVALSNSINKVGTSISNFINTMGVTAMLGALTACVLAIAGAISILSGISWEDGLRGVTLLGLVLAELVISLNLIKNNFADNIAGGASYAIIMLALGKVISSMGNTLKKISSVSWGDGIKSVVLMGLLLGELIGAMKLVSMITGDATSGPLGGLKQNGFMRTIAYVANSLSNTLKNLSKIKFFDGIKAVGLLGALLVELVTTMEIISQVSKNDHTMKSIAMMAAISLVAGMLAGTLKKVSKIPFASGIGALALLGGLMTELYFVMEAMSKLQGPTGGLSSMATMIGFALAIRIIAGAVKSLGELSFGSIASALTAIGGISAIMVLLEKEMAAIGSPKTLLNSILGMLPVILAVGTITFAMWALSEMDPNQIKAVSRAITLIMGAMAAMTVGLRMATKIKPLQALGLVATLGILVGEIAGIFWLMKDMDTKNMLVIANSLSRVITALAIMSAATGLLGGFSGIIGGSAVAVDVMLANIAAIMVIAAYIEEKRPSIRKFLEKGIPLLETLGEGFGSLIGGFLKKAVFEPLGDSFKGVGESLQSFIDNIIPFIDGTNELPEDTSGLERLGSLMSQIGGLGFDSWLASIKGAFADTTGQKTTFKNLNKFIKQFNKFKSNLDGFGEDNDSTAKLGNIKTILETLSDINWTTIKSSFLQIWAKGANLNPSFAKVKRLAEKTAELQTSLEAFSTESDITGKLDVVKSALEKLGETEWAGFITSIIDFWAGDNLDFTDSATHLIDFANYMRTFSSTIEGVSDSAITKTESALGIITKFVEGIPATDGWKQVFTGEINLATFGGSLAVFGDDLGHFFSVTNSIDTTGSKKVLKRLNSFNDIFTAIMGEGGLSDPTLLGERLGNLGRTIGTLFADLSQELSDEDAKQPLIEAGKNMFNYLVEGFETAGQGKKGDSNVQGAVDNIVDQLLKGLKGGESKEALETQAVEFVQNILNTMEKTAEGSQESLNSSIITMLSEAVKAGISESNTQFTNMDTAVRKKLNYIVQSIASYKDSFTNAIGIAISGMEPRLRESIKSLSTAGQDMMKGVQQGITGQQVSTEATAKEASKGILGTITSFFGISSPSKVLAKVGEYLMMGWSNGISRYENLPINAITKTANTMLNKSGEKVMGIEDISNETMGEVLNTVAATWAYITSMIDQDMDWHPTITPVLDLSNIQNGLGGMDTLMSAGYHFGVAGIPDIYANRVNVDKTGDLYNQEAIVSQIRSLREEIGLLGDALSRMQITMSTGQVVGAVTPGIDRELGSIQKYNARWA